MDAKRTRAILHLDLDAFFCAVEEQHDPSLVGKPFAVGGRPEGRGVVASCSYPARVHGVHSAMPVAQALRLCPDLIVVSHRRGAYSEASHAVMDLLHNLTPLVEQLSIDEAFLDVTGRPEGGTGLARQVQAAIREQLGLPSSLGVASNKLVAKIANTRGKEAAAATTDGPPNAITVVPPGEEAAYLAPLPVRALWGIGPQTAARLARRGLHTIGDLAAVPERDLVALFGKHGADLHQRARGIDPRPVTPERDAKSISRETTFARDLRHRDELLLTLRRLSDSVGLRLRRQGLAGRTVTLKLRWADFTTLTRRTTLAQPIDQDAEIYAAAVDLFDAVWSQGRPVRLIGVGVSGFSTAGRQLSLWDTDADRQQRRLQATLDELRSQFGPGVIVRGRDLSPDADDPDEG